MELDEMTSALLNSLVGPGLDRIGAQLDTLAERQVALLAEIAKQRSALPELERQFDSVERTMSRVPEYQQRALRISQEMGDLNSRVRRLQKRSLRLRVNSSAAAAAAASDGTASVGQVPPPPFVEPGPFTYRVVYPGGIGVRPLPDVDANPTGEVIPCGTEFVATERRAFPGQETVFARLASGTGWVFEAKRGTRILVRQAVAASAFNDENIINIGVSSGSGSGGGDTMEEEEDLLGLGL